MEEGAPVRICVQGVSRRFGDIEALRDVSIDVRAGEIVVLLGPSGTGKTTLVRQVAAQDRPDAGTIAIDGERMPQRGLLARVGYMAQADALYPELSGRQNLSFFAGLYGLGGDLLEERAREVIGMVALEDALARPVLEYSGGMKRRLSLAIALIHHPKVLLLDEPTVGMDPVLRRSVWAGLREVAERGAAILLTTHVMDEAERCDRVYMMRDGQIIADGTPEALKRDTETTSLEDVFFHYAEAA